MKKILYNISIVILSGTMLASCNKFLDRKNEASFDGQTTFESSAKAEMAVLGIYNFTFNRELYYQLGMGTDECISTESNNSKNQIANYVISPDIAPVDTYNSMYKAIEYANICIKNLPLIKATDDKDQKKLNMLLGEAYACRAMSYLNVVRFFGDLPYPTIPVLDAGTFAASRVSRDTIYDGCVADLQKAVDLLPWKSEGLVPTPERFTKNAAYGILARTALYAAGFSLRWDLNTYAASSVKLAQRPDAARIRELYQIASDACNAVIQKGENSLLLSYEQVFRDLVSGKYNNESMLEYGQYGTDPNSSANQSAIGYTNGMFVHTNSMFGKSAPAMGIMPTFYYDFQDGDKRRDVSIATYGITDKNARQLNSYGANTIGKFRVTWKTALGTAINKRDIDWPWLRYSDVLLMYAEAQNELNNAPTPTAITAYELVRKRGFGGDTTKIGTTPTTYSDFRNAVINERKLELAFEGWRRSDLVRWGIEYETLTQCKQNLIDMANHTGKYANIDLYRTYKLETATSWNDPAVTVAFTGYKTKLNGTDSAAAKTGGLTILDMYSNVAASGGQTLEQNQQWIKDIFRGLEKNKSELFPLNSTSIINNNPGLAGQQHPLY